MAGSVQIPGIELGEELGRGAYSAVYRGRHRAGPCAVKVPLVGGQWTRWMYREAVALARVRHPNLPAVFEVGEVDELPYLVMELVEGETLADRLFRGPLEQRELYRLARGLAEALRAVHRVGLVHRDVKPRNIALGRDDGRVRLIDFGFATPIDVTTRARDRAGTSGYAAPEQFRINGHVDGRADLYALGRVLIECLGDAGVRSAGFDGPSASTEEGRVSLLRQVIQGLTADKAEDRYPDASALLRDLQLVDDGQAALGPAAYSAQWRGLPVVARTAEVDRLNRAWRTLGSRGSLVLLRGARGAGKTRLLAECAAAARESLGRRVIEISCREGDAPLATLRRLFEFCVAAIVTGSSPSERAAGERKVQLAIGEHLRPFARLIAPHLRGVLGLGDIVADAAPGGFADGAAELLVRLARIGGPLVVLLDDVQWIDPVSRDAISRLAERIDDSHVALVVAARSDADLSAFDEHVTNQGGAPSTVIDLALLDDVQISELVSSYLGDSNIDPAFARRVGAMADGTPLGVLEVLGAFLDAGALRPQPGSWVLDARRAERIQLPVGALVLLGRRVAELPPATRRVLEVAAVIGTAFDEGLLAEVVGVDRPDLDYALADARRAGLVEPAGPVGQRLVHDSLREMLVIGVPIPARRTIHQRIAEALDTGEELDFETLCSCARHYGEGEAHKSPARAQRTARLAAEAALTRFDNETALRFFDLAESAGAGSEGFTNDAEFFLSVGEAHLRLGALSESRSAFDEALDRAKSPELRAAILGRVAWVEQARADPERAWMALGEAFAVVGARMPVESATSAALTLGHVTRAEVLRRTRRPPPLQRRGGVELLCDLHYQNARLGTEYGKPFRVVQSTLEGLVLSETLGASRARAGACASYGVFLSALGRRRAGARELELARRMASELGDVITEAFCVQLQGVAACISGDFESALSRFRECVSVYGPWLEQNEYCLVAASADFAESLRGRPLEALEWSTKAVERERRGRAGSSASSEYLVHRRRAALASLDEGTIDDPWLARHRTVPSRQGSFYRVMSWGPRARYFLETGNLGQEFEALVEAFKAERHNPRTTHPMVVEYYIAVAHARVHQCLRADTSERLKRLPELREALRDLRASAKVPLYKAHCLVIEGAYAWCSGSSPAARGYLAKAEVIAESESAPWVLSLVARVRAHMLRQEGKEEAACDQARVAELFATQYGAEPHARWVREEFSLLSDDTEVSSRSSDRETSSHLRRELSSLLNILKGPSVDVQPVEHAKRILDDLIRDVDADRGVLWFLAEPGTREELVVGRTARGTTWVVATPPGLDVSKRHVVSAPLVLYELEIGGIHLERDVGANPFSAANRELLGILSHQIPVTFEIGRLLAERDQLQRSLDQAQKMDAIGQLAGGVAHDFNDALAKIRSSLDLLRRHVSVDERATQQIEAISDATRRASQLTGQLLCFSQHQPIPMIECQLNDAISQVEPILRRLLGDRIRLEISLGELYPVLTARAAFDQMMVNLVLNARDAMPNGGQVRISTRNVSLDGAAVRRGAPSAGEYAMIEVSDTGRGMTPDIVARAFEPFFTTKERGLGSGVGLTTVYALVKKCHGHVDVMSDIDRGTSVSIYLPAATRLPATTRLSTVPPPAGPDEPSLVPGKAASTILVVDDDFGVRSSIEKILRRAGYQVLTAAGASETLDLVRARRAEISLVILDMMIPGMSGPELRRRLVELEVNAPVLFVSGFSPDSLQAGQTEIAERFLQKPFEISELLSRVRRLLDAA